MFETARPSPETDAEQGRPTVSIVVPCLNEEITVGTFVDWCHEGLAKAGVTGEVIIVDSSTDRSPEIAEAHGARVLRVPKRGLGRAYIDAIPEIRGRYVIMGDCDLTYDFRELAPFIRELEAGKDFVMGSRFRGSIEEGAMPRLHQHFGTPLTTWILNRLHRTRFSDIHCGMRAMTIEALRRIDLSSQGWEYASEMILKAVRLKLDTAEVPVVFYRDPEGRESVHVRMGWWSPWLAGWDNLKVMILFAPEVFLIAPGILFTVLGLVVSAILALGPVDLGGVELSLNTSLLALTMTVLGYSALQLGLLAQVHHDLEDRMTTRLTKSVSYNRGTLTALGLALVGLALEAGLVAEWISEDFELDSISHPAVFGLLLIILGFQTFAFTFLLQIVPPRRARQDA